SGTLLNVFIIQRCCHRHDCCYGKAEVAGCSPKLDPYNFVCKDKQAECDSLKDRCQKMICKCDSEAAKCWAKARFNPSLKYFQQNSCGTIQPLCKADKNKKRVLLENH
uniref:Phospholipase A2 n=1 Tax=Ornithorhynchus anatinus TaxID=9258 RepID=A0A6I8P255_ORNAN